MAAPPFVLRPPPGSAGTVLDSAGIKAAEKIPAAHKVALTAIATGEEVRRYGQIIGFATAPIAPGDHVHVQNLAMADFERDYAFSEGVIDLGKAPEPLTFMGIKRADRRVAT